MIRQAIHTAVSGAEVPAEVMTAAVGAILSGETTESEIAAFVVALRMKGETAAEIAAAASAMRTHCEAIVPNVTGPLLDTCGTGGDGLDTFNISTAAAIVVSACGVPIAKHGNRAVSSKAGSADVLAALGVNIELGPAAVTKCIEKVGIGFMFAPTHHRAMRHAAPVRRQLGLRTIFNLLGPLSNPANATHQVVGVYDGSLTVPLAEALHTLGLQSAWVVHGQGGMDEVTPYGTTSVAELRHGAVGSRTVTPKDFGMKDVSPDSLVGGDAETNAAIISEVLAGADGGPRAAVLINTAAALWVAGRARDLCDATTQAETAIDSGAAKRKLEEWTRQTHA